jgi:hypothetical protein
VFASPCSKVRHLDIIQSEPFSGGRTPGLSENRWKVGRTCSQPQVLSPAAHKDDAVLHHEGRAVQCPGSLHPSPQPCVPYPAKEREEVCVCMMAMHARACKCSERAWGSTRRAHATSETHKLNPCPDTYTRLCGKVCGKVYSGDGMRRSAEESVFCHNHVLYLTSTLAKVLKSPIYSDLVQ